MVANSLRHRLHWLALRGFMVALFALVLPLAARIGGRTARRMATWAGLTAFRLDVDWRTVSLRQHFLRERTQAALREILPDASPETISALTRERFICAAHEDLDAQYFYSDPELTRQCSYEGLEAVHEAAARTGVLVMTLHLDTTPMGIAQLGKTGLKLNLMTSNIVQDPRVPAVLRRFFRRKYEGIERHLNGGIYWDVETHIRDFYRVLARGESVAMLCDGPALSLEDGVLTEFLGKTRAMSPGALRLAKKSGAALVGMICLRTGPESYRVVFSPVYEPSALAPEQAIHEVYAFLDQAIRATPGRWWAADLLPAFINVENKA